MVAIIRTAREWVVRRLIGRRARTEFTVDPQADARHPLRLDEHEAFYFLFTSEDGTLTGGLRALVGPDSLLEMAALRSGDRAWLYQRRAPYQAGTDPYEIAGPQLRFRCHTPWEHWAAHFNGMALTPTGDSETLDIALHYRATTPPAALHLGAYTQVQQDGRLQGTLCAPGLAWEGELLCYRDHSWGRRGAGNIPGWMIIDIPEHLYAFILGDMDFQPVGLGRWIAPDGTLRPLVAPRVMPQGAGWRVSDPRAGMSTWTFTRLTPAGVSYLGAAGEEAVKSQPGPGDRFVDEIGPAVFTAEDNRQIVGFWDQARRLHT